MESLQYPTFLQATHQDVIVFVKAHQGTGHSCLLGKLGTSVSDGLGLHGNKVDAGPIVSR